MQILLDYQVLTISLIPDTLLSANYNLFLNGLSSVQQDVTLTDNDGVLYVGEDMTFGSRNVEILGSGTAQPGVDLLGIVVPTGTKVDVIYMRDTDTGQLLLAYPEGAPNILSAISLVLTIDEVGYDLNTNAPICFCKGTGIMTPGGPKAVERLGPGDVVLDWSGTPLKVEAVASSYYPSPPAEWRPVVFEANALGAGLPRSRLKVSPQHRICLPGEDPCIAPLLGPARAFTVLRRIRTRRSDAPVTYFHIVTERHALLQAEGVPAESLLLAGRCTAKLSPAVRTDLARQLGLSEETLSRHPSATPCGQLLRAQDARKMVDGWSVHHRLNPTAAWGTARRPALRAVG